MGRSRIFVVPAPRVAGDVPLVIIGPCWAELTAVRSSLWLCPRFPEGAEPVEIMLKVPISRLGWDPGTITPATKPPRSSSA